MEFEQAVRRRRMVRHFKSDPVAIDAITKIISLAQRSPSAGFSQGAEFIIVSDPETKRKLSLLADEEVYSRLGFHPWISEAPFDIVICVNEQAYHDRYTKPDLIRKDGTEIEWPIPFWFFDIGCATMTLLLAAVNEGLGAAFAAFRSADEVRRLLGIPTSVHPMGVVSIGHAAKDMKSPFTKYGRVALDRIIHIERW